MTALNASPRAEIYDMIRFPHSFGIMFHDDDRVAFVAEGFESMDELGIVARV